MERDIGFFSYMENLDLKSSVGRAMFTDHIGFCPVGKRHYKREDNGGS